MIDDPEQAAPETSAAMPADRLRTCVRHLLGGPWRLIQLRGRPLDESAIDGDDVDLIGTREAVDALTDAARSWVAQGLCHLHISARLPGKVEWRLYSIDGRHRLHLDLWIELPQLDRGRRTIRHEQLAPHAAHEHAVGRLPVDLEACLYVHHLICKRKPLAGDSAQQRLEHYISALDPSRRQLLKDVLTAIRKDKAISDAAEAMTLRHVESTLTGETAPARSSRGLRRLWHRMRAAWLAAPRRTTMLSIMGCDGAGKTTLAHAVAPMLSVPAKVFTGKHLYRKSLLYKLAVILIRPLLLRSREGFDETIAPWVYLRAAIALRWRSWRNRKARTITLIDRSLPDFLYVNRKTDAPRFSCWGWLAGLFGRRIRTVHCLVRHEIVRQRKEEMTQAGHARYDGDMFRHFTRRTPTDYILFNNEADVAASAQVLAQLLQRAEEGA